MSTAAVPTASSFAGAAARTGPSNVRRRQEVGERRARAALIALLLLGACSRKSDLDEVFPPPRRVDPVESRVSKVERFALSPRGETLFSLGARAARVTGSVDLVSGELTLDCFDLTSARGHATFDLASLTLGAAPAAEAAARWDEYAEGSLSERARQWLQAESSERPQHRFAHFTITSVGDVSANAALDGQRVRAAAGTTARRVRLRADGELTLHEVRFPYTAAFDARFEWADPAPPGSGPRSIEITTREPIIIDLMSHEIAPRLPTGEVHAGALAELRKRRGHLVRVTGRWVASAAGARGLPPASGPSGE